jgi:esterase/lipase
MQKIVFIIPGYKQKPTQPAYKKVVNILKKEKYIPVPVTIPWEENNISQNARFFLREYKRFSLSQKTFNKKIYILGFSFGAMIAFIASTKIKIDGLILCSLSPYFKEDLKTKKSHIFKEFMNLQNSKLVKKIKTKQVHMLYGANEAKPLIKRVNDTFNKIITPRKYLTAIKQTEHYLGNKRYLYQIHKTAQSLI